jgi:hypothetical protein
MKIIYDNLEDSRQKLIGTYCLYDGKAVMIKNVNDDDNAGPAKYKVSASTIFNGRMAHFELADPKFNFQNLNIGYVARADGFAAIWYYRKPLRQYRQGLRSDQVGMKFSSRRFADVGFNDYKSVAAMLENKYPNFKEVSDRLRANEIIIGAFHKNFAASFDDIHEDVIIEYKGVRVGHSTHPSKFQLVPNYEFLKEHLQEAIA